MWVRQTINRTLVELKRASPFRAAAERSAINRTLVELKHRRLLVADLLNDDYQSYLSGIKTADGFRNGDIYAAINRTLVELKRLRGASARFRFRPINRTLVELKHGQQSLGL